MSSRRAQILMGVLLVLLLGFLFRVYVQPVLNSAAPRAFEPPLAGKNSVSAVAVSRSESGDWMVDFDYFFTGEPRNAAFQVELVPKGYYTTYAPLPLRGAHHVRTKLAYPGREQSTQQVEVSLRAGWASNSTVLASERADAAIDWPTQATRSRNEQLAASTPADNLKRAVTLIDSSSNEALSEAQKILERLIADDPKNDAAYVELARVAMKENWGPEGLHQAENLLDSALQIRPDSVNAKILLGYVYAHQNRFAKAEALFVEAARSNPPNLWLWSNWGELLLMQGKLDEASAKYREAIRRPVTHDTYDRARADAYRHLLALLERRKDLDGMEALYKQRVADFGPGSCYSADYARFLLNARGDPAGAIALSRRALNQDCDDAPSRQILGLAHYVQWAQAGGPDGAAALNQARIFLPAGPTAIYELAKSERTLPAARKLLASGEAIDQKDNDKYTALAYALQNEDLAPARRLLSLGAHPETPVGFDDMPAALLPVLRGNLEAIRVLQRAGVDYSKLRYRGATALDFAKQTGNDELLQALGRKELAL